MPPADGLPPPSPREHGVVTLPGAHVYIGIVGHNIDTVELQDFAFLGNRDTPSSPTLWGNPNS